MYVNKFKYLCGEEGVYGERRGIWKIYLSSTEVYGKYTSPLQRYMENIPPPLKNRILSREHFIC